MGRAPCCDKASVKRGPWSSEEDSRLKSYIEQYGTGGNWISLPQKIGLNSQEMWKELSAHVVEYRGHFITVPCQLRTCSLKHPHSFLIEMVLCSIKRLEHPVMTMTTSRRIVHQDPRPPSAVHSGSHPDWTDSLTSCNFFVTAPSSED